MATVITRLGYVSLVTDYEVHTNAATGSVIAEIPIIAVVDPLELVLPDIPPGSTIIVAISYTASRNNRAVWETNEDGDPIWFRDDQGTEYTWDNPGPASGFQGILGIQELHRAYLPFGLTGAKLLASQAYWMSAIAINQSVHRRIINYSIPPLDHDHPGGTQPPNNAPPTGPWHMYGPRDFIMAQTPTLMLGMFEFGRGNQVNPPYAPFPREAVELGDGITDLDEPESSLTVRRFLHAGATLGSPVIASGEINRFVSARLGYRIFKRPLSSLDVHFDALWDTGQIPPQTGLDFGGNPITSYPVYVWKQAVGLYSILDDEQRGVDVVQLNGPKWLVRISQKDGAVTVERSFDQGATWPEDAARTLGRASSTDAVPTLMVTPRDELFAWFHDSAENKSYCWRSVDNGETWGEWAEHSLILFPRAVWHRGRTLLVFHDGAEALKVYGSENYGQDLELLAVSVTTSPEPQLAGLRVDRRGNAHLVWSESGGVWHQESEIGAEWSTPNQMIEDARLPSLATGRRWGFTAWRDTDAGLPTYKIGRTNEIHTSMVEEVSLPVTASPADAIDPNQYFGSMVTHRDEWILCAWTQITEGGSTRIDTFWSRDTGANWSAPS